MGPTLSPETSAFKIQTPGKFPEEYKLHPQQISPSPADSRPNVFGHSVKIQSALLTIIKPLVLYCCPTGYMWLNRTWGMMHVRVILCVCVVQPGRKLAIG